MTRRKRSSRDSICIPRLSCMTVASNVVLLALFRAVSSHSCAASSRDDLEAALECDPLAENRSESLHLLQRSAGRVSGASVTQCGSALPVQVFLDVDDTYKSSCGHHPAGCDGL
mmetsp:Transcript_154740/g.475402  ORF Transcript_154740/g.475402 Transcript_154740/m.475402 type:complete len:114 (+) Transcript_154740:190-531(+)